jgi:hypothetical protein
MTVWLRGVRKGDWRRDGSGVETVALHLGGRLLRGRQMRPTFLERQNDCFRQGSPVALRRANELVSNLVDGMLMVVMRCLRSWAPASRRMPRQSGREGRSAGRFCKSGMGGAFPGKLHRGCAGHLYWAG